MFYILYSSIMNNENTPITALTGQGDTFPSRYSSPSAGKREGIMKHTKGKWLMEDRSDKITQVISYDINTAEAKDICVVSDDWNEQVANANLIAAAPEMLSLLKRFLEAPGYKEGRDNTKWMLLEEMKAITIKAEGK